MAEEVEQPADLTNNVSPGYSGYSEPSSNSTNWNESTMESDNNYKEYQNSNTTSHHFQELEVNNNQSTRPKVQYSEFDHLLSDYNNDSQFSLLPCGQGTPKYKHVNNQDTSIVNPSGNSSIFTSTNTRNQVSEDQTYENNDLSLPDINNLISSKPVYTLPKQHKNVNIPTNHTLSSNNKGTVVLIKVETEHQRELLSNPQKINNILTVSDFNTIDIKDIRINHRRGLIAVEARQALLEYQIKKLTAIKMLGQYKVCCYQPNTDILSYGVIGRISQHMNLEQLKFDIDTFSDIEIRSVERLKKRENKEWIDSPSIKITFVSSNCPEYVSLYHVRYKVRSFVPDIMQCYRCQRLGHTFKSCTAKYPRCVHCSGPHKKDDCETLIKTCANCHENHSAYSNSCRYIKEARTVEQIRAKQNIDYTTARNELIKQKNDMPQANSFPPLRSGQPNNNQMRIQQNDMNYAEALYTEQRTQRSQPPSYRNRTYNTNKPTLVTKSVQTDKTDDKVCLCTSDGFFIKLKQLIVELLVTNINKDNPT